MIRWLVPAATIGVIVAPWLGRWFGASFFLAELLSHFPVQYAGLAGLLLTYWLGRRNWLLALTALVGLVQNGLLCLPLFADSATPRQPGDLRVYHANVLYTRDDYRPVIDTIEKLRPDFFVLHEMPREGVAAVAALRKTYPYQDSVWAKGPCYILVGSQTPIVVDESARRSHRVISLTSTVRGRRVSLITVHPRTPLLPSWFRERNRQLSFVSQLLIRSAHPTILIGDFNISPFSPVYAREFTKPPISACRTGFGWTPTWPRFLPPAYLPIDHALINNGFNTASFRTLVTPGSDHRAIVADLLYR